jgi:sensor c-di-GMP phosphodiesterase-like protein
MNKIIKVLGTTLSMLALGASSAFAVVPVPDANVVSATTDSISGLQTAGTTNLATLIPIAAVLLISVAVLYFVVKHFRSLAHV